MDKKYAPILPGEGATDYERYMRTNVLLSLQRTPEQVIHRDELLFQIVHQATELWLKLATAETAAAAQLIRDKRLAAASAQCGRSSLAVIIATQQLEMLTHLAPWAFQVIRTILGHGSGFESPGWSGLRQAALDLGAAFDEALAASDADLAELYRGDTDTPEYLLAEALVDLDERISVWRVRHFKVATRIIGHGVTGTKGTPVDTLSRLISEKLFPRLWQVRTELTRTGPMAYNEPGAVQDQPDQEPQ
jgi:tryptophan 2,3-dioxygenase